MNDKDFDQIVKRRLRNCQDVLTSKNKEYSSDADRLHNFKRAGAMLNCSPEKALEGMWAKHLVSVQDLINDPSKVSMVLINEKIGDSINYLLLLEGLFMERLQSEVSEEEISEWTILEKLRKEVKGND